MGGDKVPLTWNESQKNAKKTWSKQSVRKEGSLEMIKKNAKARKERLTHNKDESKDLIQTSLQYNYFPNIETHLLH